jgi:hypothetical protein
VVEAGPFSAVVVVPTDVLSADAPSPPLEHPATSNTPIIDKTTADLRMAHSFLVEIRLGAANHPPVSRQ